MLYTSIYFSKTNLIFVPYFGLWGTHSHTPDEEKSQFLRQVWISLTFTFSSDSGCRRLICPVIIWLVWRPNTDVITDIITNSLPRKWTIFAKSSGNVRIAIGRCSFLPRIGTHLSSFPFRIQITSATAGWTTLTKRGHLRKRSTEPQHSTLAHGCGEWWRQRWCHIRCLSCVCRLVLRRCRHIRLCDLLQLKESIEVLHLRNIKHFPCWYTVISTRVEIGKTRNCVETRRPQGEVFSHNFEFFQFSRVLI